MEAKRVKFTPSQFGLQPVKTLKLGADCRVVVTFFRGVVIRFFCTSPEKVDKYESYSSLQIDSFELPAFKYGFTKAVAAMQSNDTSFFCTEISTAINMLNFYVSTLNDKLGIKVCKVLSNATSASFEEREGVFLPFDEAIKLSKWIQYVEEHTTALLENSEIFSAIKKETARYLSKFTKIQQKLQPKYYSDLTDYSLYKSDLEETITELLNYIVTWNLKPDILSNLINSYDLNINSCLALCFADAEDLIDYLPIAKARAYLMEAEKDFFNSNMLI